MTSQGITAATASSHGPRDLSTLNTLGVPSRAQHFAAATSIEDVRAACAWARDRHLRVLVLGGGSNVIPAEDIPALVLRADIKGIEAAGASGTVQYVKVGAGEDWHQLVRHCLSQGWYGLENLSLIPGTTGAAPIQNIGAYGVELSQVFESLQAVNIATGAEETFDLERCAFGYRDSVFKNTLRGLYVVVSVTLRLSRVPQIRADYPALAAALSRLEHGQITPQRVSEAVCAIRRSKLPDPAEVPNCGSFFKNPVISSQHFDRLRAQYPKAVAYALPDGQTKLAAGWLIEQAGWKGKSHGDIVVHPQQALVLTNPNHVPAEQVLAAATAIQADIQRLFDVQLEIEPQLLK